MDYIIEVLNKEFQSIEELIDCFDKLKECGDVAVIKFDGERENNQHTIFITFPTKNRDLIRYDGDNLKEGLFLVLKEYTKVG